jgi:hypothetical protein
MSVIGLLSFVVLCAAAWVGFGVDSQLTAVLGQVTFFLCLVVFMVAQVLRSLRPDSF